MNLRVGVGMVAAAVALVISGCGGDEDEAAGGKATGVKVAATTTIVGDLVNEVAGERSGVTVLLAPNGDPHDYEPRPSDAKAVASAALVVRSGGDLDAWLDDIVSGAGGERDELSLIDAVRELEGEEHGESEKHADEEKHADGEKHADENKHSEGDEHDHEGADPHWWQDPNNAVLAVASIEKALSKIDPDGAAVYAANAKAYTARITALDREIATCLASIPENERKLVTNHDAFAYFANRYGFEVIGTVIPGLSTRSQASAGEVTALVRTIRREGVPAIFTENTVTGRLEQVIADRAGAKVGRPLISDALSPQGKPGDTYLGMVRLNAAAVADGLGASRSACAAIA